MNQMNSPSRPILTLESVLYLLAFGLALCLRFLNLGAFPLSAFESELAVRGLNLASGSAGTVGAQPAYIAVTSLIFAIFKSSEAAARFLPAFSGSLLVFFPLFFRNLYPPNPRYRTAAVIFAFAAALDPGLVAASRMVGSPMPAIVFSLLSAGFIWQGNAILAGLLAGLAVMSGTGFIEGALAVCLAVLLAFIFDSKLNILLVFRQHLPSHIQQPTFWRKMGLFAVIMILAGGLLWLRVPQGLVGLSSLFPAYLAGWLQPSGMPAFRLPVALVLYQPLVVTFGLVAVLRAWLQASPAPTPNRFLSLWAGSALILAMLYPSRQVVGILWVVVPLWLMAASELNQHIVISPDSRQRLAGMGLAGLVALFIFLIWYNLLRLGNLGAQYYLYLAIIGGLIMMGIILVILVLLGWGFPAVRFGLVWGSSLIMGFYMLAAMWGGSQVHPNDPVELWTIAPGPGQPDELLDTLMDLSSWHYGFRNSIRIHTNLVTPDVHWALRDFPNTVYLTTIDPNLKPDIILTSVPQSDTDNLSGYLGQPLTWSRTALWNGILPPNLLRWLTYRELPTAPQMVVIWARTDLFPGGLSSSTELPLSPGQPIH